MGKAVEFAIAAMLMALLAAACGGTSSSGGAGASTTAEIGKGAAEIGKGAAGLVKEADLICKRSAKSREAKLAAARGKPPTNDTAELERLVTQAYVPSLEEMVGELTALHPSRGDQQSLEEIAQAYEQGIEKLRSDPGSALSEPAFRQADRLAAEFGLVQCAKIG